MIQLRFMIYYHYVNRRTDGWMGVEIVWRFASPRLRTFRLVIRTIIAIPDGEGHALGNS